MKCPECNGERGFSTMGNPQFWDECERCKGLGVVDLERSFEDAAAQAEAGLASLAEREKWLETNLVIAMERAKTHLAEGPDVFQSLDIRYHPPFVSRLWFETRVYEQKFRVYLHRIEPMTSAPGTWGPDDKNLSPILRWDQRNALFHPHPWPCAIMLLRGQYQHTVGTKDGPVSTEVLGKEDGFEVVTKANLDGPRYAMTDPSAWHSVRTYDKPAYTLMIVGDLYPEDVRETEPHSHQAKGKVSELAPERKLRLWWDFCRLLGVVPGKA